MTKGCNSGVVPSRSLQRSRDFMKHYYDYTSRLFSDGRAGDYLNELFLNAAKNGDYERVQNFLARTSKNMAVNVDAKEKETGHTAVMLAAMNQHSKVVSLLLNYGADITLCNNNGQSILDLTADSMRPLLLGSVARQGFSSSHLLQAAWQGNLPLVKKLLSSKSNLDVNCTNADGLTPLLLVTRDMNLFEKIEKAVMENGYHPVEVVKELLQNKADIAAKDSEGKRPLHFVAHGKGSNAKSVIDILIQNCGRNIDVPDGLGNSPLHCASRDDNRPILLALIKGGADVNVRGHVGRTPLHVAASHGHETSSGMLLEHGADVTITDDNGLSPVDVAKGKRVQKVLTEAWAEQTKDNKMKGKRIFSAPTSHIIETEPSQTEANTESQDVPQTNNIASQTEVRRKLKKRSKSSIGSMQRIEERTRPTPPRKESDLRMPRIPSAQKSDSNQGSKSSSTFIAKELLGKKEVDVGRKEKHQAVMLPSLSVLNIQLSYVRNLRGDRNVLQAKMAAVHQPSPPRRRLRYRLSSPVLSYPRRLSTPRKDNNERLRSFSTSQVPDYKVPSRLAVPSRVPPLGLHRVLTPELRSLASPDTVQEMLPVVDLDLLRKVGHRATDISSMMSSEVREATPPPPSPLTGTESPLPSAENKDLDLNSLEAANELEKTRTFSSIPRSTFWIPVGNDIENKTDTNASDAPISGKDPTASNGTSFYIDLKNLEALASGQCSACGKSLPEGNQTGDCPRSSKSPIDHSVDKKVCKSCQPRRRSSEDVFWIPFTDKEKTSIVKRKSCEESERGAVKTQNNRNFRSNANRSCVEKDESLMANDPEKLTPVSRVDSGFDPSRKLVVQNNGKEPSTSNQQQLEGVMVEFPEMTGFDVSCVCNNVSGVCSCTIVRKEISSTSLVPSEQAPQSIKGTFLTESALTFVNADVVKTVGESSPLTGPTVAERQSDNCASGDAGASTVLDGVLVDSFETSKATELQDKQTREPQETSCEVDREQDGVGEKQGPSPPKEAWTSPRKEEPGTGGVKIWNPYPSPLPPEDKSAVHPPIGPASDCRLTSRKGRNGKVKSKKSVGKSKVNTTKTTKPKNKIQSQGQSSKPGKKKAAKGRKVPEVKMITVQQREATEELGLRTISQGGGFDMLESVPCPPTISQSTFPRPFHSRALCGKCTVLSPIPESPRSLVNTPRRVDVPESIHEVGSEVEQQVAVEDETQRALCNSTKEVTEHGLGIADDGFISRLFGKCIPQLKLTTSDTESDSESNDPLVNQIDPISQPVAMVPERRTNDNLFTEWERGSQDFVPDEADDENEKASQNQLLRPDTELNSSSFGEMDNSFTDVTNDQHSEFLERTDESCIISFKYSTAVQQNLVQAEEEESEPTSTDEEFDRPSVSSRSSTGTTFNSEEFSDTDSSYNSCDSASPRPPSSSSSLNSSDTYFSSPRDSSCAATPTPDHDTYSENSVEIDYFERILSRDKSSASCSSDSTVRAQSNTSFGSFQESTDSFSSGSLVRSRLSATSRSQSCLSCEDEIVWKKGNILGKGAFGTVFCGLTNTGEIIAVKQVELNHSNIEEAEKQYEKLQEEVSLLKSLNHENIVRFIGTCFDCGVVNIFMEYVPGGSIASILSRFGCLDESVFCRYTKQLLSGVSYLHGNNVIHRDIKGGNILVMPSGVLKLIDFGCAKRLCLNLSMSKSNILRSMKGTPYWMAPEVIRETGHGRKSDIWSVGCTVYEMATGKPPWSDMPPMAAIFAIGSGTLAVPELGESFSKEARDFVNKCLTRDPDVRPSADELRQHQFLKNPS